MLKISSLVCMRSMYSECQPVLVQDALRSSFTPEQEACLVNYVVTGQETNYTALH